MTPGRRHLVLASVSVLLVAACLRPAVTSVGPLLDQIGDGTGFNELQLGLLGALPVIMFALCSPLAGLAARPRGMEAAVAAALIGLTVGTLIRSSGGVPGLWFGTAVIGASIAVANVLTPTLVKRDFGKPALATAVFATALSGSAAVASGVSVPLADALGGWREGLAFWAAVPALVLPVWLVRTVALRSHKSATAIDPGALRHVARSPIAWQVATFFGLQSLVFYTLITWLPTIEQSFGTSPGQAGVHLLVFQLVGCVAGILVGLLMEGRTDQRVAGVAVSLPVVVAMAGFVLAPQLALLWVIIGSTGAGSALSVALALVVLRTTNSSHTTALSALAQSFGYLIAALGPAAAGLLSHLGGWRVVLGAVGLVAIAQTVLSLWAARGSVIGGNSGGVAEDARSASTMPRA